MDNRAQFIGGMNAAIQEAYFTATAKGWHNVPNEDGTDLALIHSELSEALEGLPLRNASSEHCAGLSQLEEELADTVIRIFDFAASRHLHLPEAIIAKMEFNKSRPFKHGGKNF